MRRITNPNALRIGELAERARLTVRTLHHYDKIGLVHLGADGGRAPTLLRGRRRRLYQVVALRSLGVPLARIALALEGTGSR
jgi:DNA-binding transcriptional MerR regulator